MFRQNDLEAKLEEKLSQHNEDLNNNLESLKHNLEDTKEKLEDDLGKNKEERDTVNHTGPQSIITTYSYEFWIYLLI